MSRRLARPAARVLVIDGTDSFGRGIARILRTCDVKLCSAVEAARAELLQGDFDVVISDVCIAEDSGLRFFSDVTLLRPELAARYFFVCGTPTEPETKGDLIRTGAPFLQKPIDLDEFRGVIAWILSVTAARRRVLAERRCKAHRRVRERWRVSSSEAALSRAAGAVGVR